MFCPNCGSQLNDGAQFCPNCGVQLSAPQQQYQQTQQQYQQQYQQPQQPYSKHAGKDYHKLGGWLMVFEVLFIISVVGALYSSITGIVNWCEQLGYWFSSGKYAYIIPFIIEVIVYIASIIVPLLTAIKIYQKDTSFLFIYQVGTMIYGVIQVLYNIIYNVINSLYHTYYSGYITSIVSSCFGIIIGTVLGVFLLTLYFKKSVRVRTYFESPNYLEKAFFANIGDAPEPYEGN